MDDRRTETLQPLRNLVIAGNLLAVVTRNPENFTRSEREELANTWAVALAELRKTLLSMLKGDE